MFSSESENGLDSIIGWVHFGIIWSASIFKRVGMSIRKIHWSRNFEMQSNNLRQLILTNVQYISYK